MNTSFELPETFWDKVNKTETCWEWTAALSGDGYGNFFFKGKFWRTPRLMMASIGVSIDGLVVRHSCDNPKCVNPEHLLTGTHADNMRDCINRGRFRTGVVRGEDKVNAKLTNHNVIMLRQKYASLPRYASGRVKTGELKRLAAQQNVTFATLTHIVGRQSWRHL